MGSLEIYMAKKSKKSNINLIHKFHQVLYELLFLPENQSISISLLQYHKLKLSISHHNILQLLLTHIQYN